VEKDRQLAKALAWGALVPFVVVDLVPGSIPRYGMPALVPACWLLAMTFCEENLRWPGWLGGKLFSFNARRRTIIGIVVLACLAMWTYAIAIVPKMDRRQRIKRLAAQIQAAIPQAEAVYALDPNYQPIFFYMRSKLVYASEIDEVPIDARYLLVRPEREQEVLESNRWAPRQPHRIMRSTDYRKESILLLKID
jgi:4-amino-4-deoxy-L-arabinose transferase-like glycosyltransferase